MSTQTPMSPLQSSTNYREITLEEARALPVADGWTAQDMPKRQYETVVRQELGRYKRGEAVKPYDVLVDLLRRHPLPDDSLLLDIGCSSGYYRDVLRMRGIPYRYIGVEQSEAMARFGRKEFDASIVTLDATDQVAMQRLFETASVDVVVSGGMLMHTLNYANAIAECQRIARRQIVFHRTPIHYGPNHRYFIKDAYGLPTLEIWFSMPILENLFHENGWAVTDSERVSYDEAKDEGHISCFLERRA